MRSRQDPFYSENKQKDTKIEVLRELLTQDAVKEDELVKHLEEVSAKKLEAEKDMDMTGQ